MLKNAFKITFLEFGIYLEEKASFSMFIEGVINETCRRFTVLIIDFKTYSL